MLQITSPINGAILNHNHGVETDKSLKIKVTGISQTGTPVMVNGAMATMDGLNFSADVELTQRVNKIRASAYSANGMYTQEVTVLWDKNSFKRYCFYIDDHSFLFTDLAKERPARAFDHFYLAALKKMHEESDLKVTLNAFYHNDHPEFTLDQMPDTWKSEFIDNSDWLRFSFHAKSEFPDRPYAEASAEEFGRDWDQVQHEIERFAGKESFILPVVIHWANVSMPVAQECIRRGMKTYSTAFRLRVMGGPSLAERQAGGAFQKSAAAEQESTGFDTNMGIKLHYGFTGEMSQLNNHFCYYDPLMDVVFSRGIACGNLIPLADIPARMESAIQRAEACGCEALLAGSHEQYSFPYYVNYLPDHLDRLTLMCRMLKDAGFTGSFFSYGLLGNEVWGK